MQHSTNTTQPSPKQLALAAAGYVAVSHVQLTVRESKRARRTGGAK